MSVKFNEEQTKTYITKQTPKGIIGFLLKHKIAKDIQQANIIMIGMIIILGIITFIALSHGSSRNNTGSYPTTDPTTELPI